MRLSNHPKLISFSQKDIIIEGYSLDFIRDFIKFMGVNISYPVIHVGGTSGKGSVSVFIDAILASQGFKTGRFMSPHVSDVKERISFNMENISSRDFDFFLDKVLVFTDRYMLENNSRRLTYFELILMTSLLYFDSKKVDVVVMEVGLGGKLDTTNAIDTVLQVVTNVGLDHTRILGDTKEKIARDKVQIVKDGGFLMTSEEDEKILQIFGDWVELKGAGMATMTRDFGYRDVKLGIFSSSFDYFQKAGKLDTTQGVKRGNLQLTDLKISMVGKHQVKNATLALAATFKFFDIVGFEKIDIANIRKFLSMVKIPGRIEIKSQKPLIVWDAAHNIDKMSVLIDYLDELTSGDILMLLAFKSGENKAVMLENLGRIAPRIKKIVLTSYKQAQDMNVVSEKISNFRSKIESIVGKRRVKTNLDANMAYQSLQAELSKDEILVVTGSFFLLSELSVK